MVHQHLSWYKQIIHLCNNDKVKYAIASYTTYILKDLIQYHERKQVIFAENSHDAYAHHQIYHECPNDAKSVIVLKGLSHSSQSKSQSENLVARYHI
ncbi:hypothetical protein E2C01_055759 [Portunus trituberculatus]|uniref:Uncharacterized protein n=1 Tax=Portunus trituberculatus TaxID=210409 RepID=A0A5B7GYK0_PORTR|nr:hypothetical protein [Portunus trituberculatus]